jgi:hypothetical protein
MTTAFRSQVVFLIVLLSSIDAGAQVQDQPRTRTTPAIVQVETKTGEISGRVVNENGQPLANADIHVRPRRPQELPVASTTSKRDGVFKVSGLQPGMYAVQASLPAYNPKSPEARPAVDNTSDSVTFVLIKGGVITGTVINSKGDPIVAIRIRVEMVLDASGQRSAPIVYESVTDDRGVYRVYGLPPGTYIVAADGGANYSPTGVNAFAIDMPTYAPSSSREAADQISVRVGEESNVDIRYRGERGNTIRGIVKATRPAERGFTVTLTSSAERGPRWDNYLRQANGEFAFEGIPDGDYQLVATAYWNENKRGESELMLLNVRSVDIEGLELNAAPIASVSGSVVLKPLKEPVAECTDNHQPQLSQTTVTGWHRVTQDGKQKPQFVWRSRGTEYPNAQGKFTLQNLVASEYYFGLRFSAQQWYLQSVVFAPPTPDGKPTDVSRTWTTVNPEAQLTGLTFTLAQGAALVRGKVTLAEGQTLPEKLVVYLVPAEVKQAEDALRYFASPVNSEGNFWLNNIVPGRYWMVAQPGTDDTRYDSSKIRLPDSAETRSSLRHAAAQKKTELEVKPCQDLVFRLPL